MKTQTTIDLAMTRITNAEIIEADLNGLAQDGLTIETIDEYAIVDDGQDRWLICYENLEAGIAEIVGDVLDGRYDHLAGDVPELRYTAYTDLCSLTSCLYSRIGSPSNIKDVAELEVSADVLSQIAEALAIEDELAEYQAAVEPNK
jgi:hypothetical protein